MCCQVQAKRAEVPTVWKPFPYDIQPPYMQSDIIFTTRVTYPPQQQSRVRVRAPRSYLKTSSMCCLPRPPNHVIQIVSNDITSVWQSHERWYYINKRLDCVLRQCSRSKYLDLDTVVNLLAYEEARWVLQWKVSLSKSWLCETGVWTLYDLC